MTTATKRAGITNAGFVLVAVSLGLTQVKLSYSQAAFGFAAILWAIEWNKGRQRPAFPPFFKPLMVYAGLTLFSACFSGNPVASFIDSKQLVLFLMVPVVTMFARGERANRVLDVVIAVGSAGAVYGILQYVALGYDSLNAVQGVSAGRPVGFLTHWMTFSGVLMLVTCAAVSRLLYFQNEWIWPAIAVPALVGALVLSLTRNAWLGAIAGVVVLLAVRNWRLLLVAPVAALVLVLVAPGAVMNRISSIGDTSDPATRDRIAMLRMGVHMVKDHPLTGVGPEMVQRVYAQYRDPMAVNLTNPHLHNVPMQIAAERGLPALAVWLWFVVVALQGLWRQLRAGPARAIAGAGLAAVVSMLVAGLFEYNFGDSEFLMLFLGVITLPWAAAQPALTDDPEPSRSGTVRA